MGTGDDQDTGSTEDGPASTDLLERLGDELKLQAWLARAEFRNPSLTEPGTREEVDALAHLRDELRLQLHLGRLEAREEFGRLEQRWQRFKEVAQATMEDAEESLHDVLRDIRDGYHHLTTK